MEDCNFWKNEFSSSGKILSNGFLCEFCPEVSTYFGSWLFVLKIEAHIKRMAWKIDAVKILEAMTSYLKSGQNF